MVLVLEDRRRILLNVIINMTSCIIMYDVGQSYLLRFKSVGPYILKTKTNFGNKYDIYFIERSEKCMFHMTFISSSEVKKVYFS